MWLEYASGASWVTCTTRLSCCCQPPLELFPCLCTWALPFPSCYKQWGSWLERSAESQCDTVNRPKELLRSGRSVSIAWQSCCFSESLSGLWVCKEKSERKWEVEGRKKKKIKKHCTRIACIVLLRRIKVPARGIYSQNESNTTELDSPDWVLCKLLTWAAPVTPLKDPSMGTVWFTVISDSKLQGERHDKGEIVLRQNYLLLPSLLKGVRCFDYFIHWLHLCFQPGACQSGNHLF